MPASGIQCLQAARCIARLNRAAHLAGEEHQHIAGGLLIVDLRSAAADDMSTQRHRPSEWQHECKKGKCAKVAT
eukprot:366061-Chlamydomonas_euryale.AAC.1